MMRDDPDRTVLAWSDRVGRLHTTAITLAEIEYGIARLPDGHRKDQLAETAHGVFADFDEVILAFDAPAAQRYAGIVTGRERAGRPIARQTHRSPPSVRPVTRHWPPVTPATSTAPASACSTRGRVDRRPHLTPSPSAGRVIFHRRSLRASLPGCGLVTDLMGALPGVDRRRPSPLPVGRAGGSPPEMGGNLPGAPAGRAGAVPACVRLAPPAALILAISEARAATP